MANQTENRHNQPHEQDAFVIRPEPTAEPLMSEDGLYAGSVAPNVEAVIREKTTNSVQASSVLICGNVGLLTDAAI